jgi:hypothetical protein
MIHRHYLKLVTESAAKQWFAISPDQPANVIPVPQTNPGVQASVVQAG